MEFDFVPPIFGPLELRSNELSLKALAGLYCFLVLGDLCLSKGQNLATKSIVCKIEFNQPSCWSYSVPNLLVFQQLVTLYLGGILVRIVSEIV